MPSDMSAQMSKKIDATTLTLAMARSGAGMRAVRQPVSLDVIAILNMLCEGCEARPEGRENAGPGATPRADIIRVNSERTPQNFA